MQVAIIDPRRVVTAVLDHGARYALLPGEHPIPLLPESDYGKVTKGQTLPSPTTEEGAERERTGVTVSNGVVVWPDLLVEEPVTAEEPVEAEEAAEPEPPKDLDAMTKEELDVLARDMNIQGRSTMSKDELRDAIAEALET